YNHTSMENCPDQMRKSSDFHIDTSFVRKDLVSNFNDVPQTFRQNLQGLLYNPSCNSFTDVTIRTENKELRVHKAILAASSEYFQKLFCSSSKIETIQFHQSKEVVEQLIFCMYGGCINLTLKPELILEILSEARNLRMIATLSRDYSSIITPQLDPLTSIRILANEEIFYHSNLLKRLHEYIVSNFSRILQNTSGIKIMQTISRQRLLPILAKVCLKCSDLEVESILQFILDWSLSVSLCDLLKECKTWEWPKSSQLQLLPLDKAINENEKRIAVKCIGHNFEWHINIDKGTSYVTAARDFRLIYDKVLPRMQCPSESVQQRFPAASFYWGDSADPSFPSVFICFPHNVALRWSTTISPSKGGYRIESDTVMNEIVSVTYRISTYNTDIQLDDALMLRDVTLVENPLASLILYYFSRNFTNTLTREDLLNSLPHVEYRCISSYLLFNDASKSILGK
ncbi:BTB/POZ domain-containing protein, partial [Cardiosporidium cionae]